MGLTEFDFKVIDLANRLGIGSGDVYKWVEAEEPGYRDVLGEAKLLAALGRVEARIMVHVRVRYLNQHARMVQVEYRGKTHSGRWKDHPSFPGDFDYSVGRALCRIYNLTPGSDIYLLKAAIAAWGKNREAKNDFKLSVQELQNLGDGWWVAPAI